MMAAQAAWRDERAARIFIAQDAAAAADYTRTRLAEIEADLARWLADYEALHDRRSAAETSLAGKHQALADATAAHAAAKDAAIEAWNAFRVVKADAEAVQARLDEIDAEYRQHDVGILTDRLRDAESEAQSLQSAAASDPEAASRITYITEQLVPAIEASIAEGHRLAGLRAEVETQAESVGSALEAAQEAYATAQPAVSAALDARSRCEDAITEAEETIAAADATLDGMRAEIEALNAEKADLDRALQELA